MQISRNTATCMHLSMSMQSCIQAQHLYLLSLPQSVFSLISASVLLFDCIITLYLIFTKRITVLYNIPHLQGRLNLLVSPERRLNSVFLSTAQQLSSPLGNNSAASLLVRTHLCHAHCFVFWHSRCSQASSQRKIKFLRRKKEKVGSSLHYSS